MSKLLREYADLNYDRNLIKEAIDKKVPIVLKTILQRADKENQNHRIYPRKILEREMVNYAKAIAEGRATGECVPGGTEILTVDAGWQKIEDVRPGDMIFTLNSETYKIEKEEVFKKIRKSYNDKMVHIKNKARQH